MAEISLIMACSHSPYLYAPPEEWNQMRARRPLRADVPFDSLEENLAKFSRCMKAFQTLKEKIERVRPDVLLIFGDDQNEMFHFDNFPAFGIYVGEEFEGTKTSNYRPGQERRGEGWRRERTRDPNNWVKISGHAALARELMMRLMEREFDLAFSLELPDREVGMGHAFIRPSYYLNPTYDIPILPFFVNCYYAPQPRAARCFELGQAVRDVIEKSSLDLKVAVLGSGGLWHTPGSPNAYLDEDFDQTVLRAMEAGDGRGAAGFFDSQARPGEVGDGADARGMHGGTGMRGGVGSGTGEIRNWFAAAGAADGLQCHVVDYVPVYASPCGMGFAYWE